jgi:MFS family permease
MTLLLSHPIPKITTNH